jgi:hypothetical protein
MSSTKPACSHRTVICHELAFFRSTIRPDYIYLLTCAIAGRFGSPFDQDPSHPHHVDPSNSPSFLHVNGEKRQRVLQNREIQQSVVVWQGQNEKEISDDDEKRKRASHSLHLGEFLPFTAQRLCQKGLGTVTFYVRGEGDESYRYGLELRFDQFCV